MARKKYRWMAGECAWGLLELSRIGQASLTQGYCVGELREQDLSWAVGSLVRASHRFFDRLYWHRIASFRHRRNGHDAGCAYFGVPLNTVKRLLLSWGGPEVAAFLAEAVEEALGDLRSSECLTDSAHDALTHAIGGRITACAPAELLR